MTINWYGQFGNPLNIKLIDTEDIGHGDTRLNNTVAAIQAAITVLQEAAGNSGLTQQQVINLLTASIHDNEVSTNEQTNTLSLAADGDGATPTGRIDLALTANTSQFSQTSNTTLELAIDLQNVTESVAGSGANLNSVQLIFTNNADETQTITIHTSLPSGDRTSTLLFTLENLKPETNGTITARFNYSNHFSAIEVRATASATLRERGILYISTQKLVNNIVRAVVPQASQEQLDILAAVGVKSITDALRELKQFEGRFKETTRDTHEPIMFRVVGDSTEAERASYSVGSNETINFTVPAETATEFDIVIDDIAVEHYVSNTHAIAASNGIFTYQVALTSGQTLSLQTSHTETIFTFEANIDSLQAGLDAISNLLTGSLRSALKLFSHRVDSTTTDVASPLMAQLSNPVAFVSSDAAQATRSGAQLFAFTGNTASLLTTEATPKTLLDVAAGRMRLHVPAIVGTTRQVRRELLEEPIYIPLGERQDDGTYRPESTTEDVPLINYNGVNDLFVAVHFENTNYGTVDPITKINFTSADPLHQIVQVPLTTNSGEDLGYVTLDMTLDRANSIFSPFRDVEHVKNGAVAEGQLVVMIYNYVDETTGAVPAQTIDIGATSDTALVSTIYSSPNTIINYAKDGVARQLLIPTAATNWNATGASFTGSGTQIISLADLNLIYPHRLERKLGLFVPQTQNHNVVTVNGRLEVLDDRGNRVLLRTAPQLLTHVQGLTEEIPAPTEDDPDATETRTITNQYDIPVWATKIHILFIGNSNTITDLYVPMPDILTADLPTGSINFKQFGGDTHNPDSIQIGRVMGVTFARTSTANRYSVAALAINAGTSNTSWSISAIRIS